MEDYHDLYFKSDLLLLADVFEEFRKVCLRNYDLDQGPVLERPGNLTGPESDFDIKVSRKEGRVLTSDEVHFVSLADNFTVQFSNLLKLPLEWKTKQLNGPGNYRELRETGPCLVLHRSRFGLGCRFESVSGASRIVD